MNRTLKLAKLSILVCFISITVRANPIEIRFFNEILLEGSDGSGWAIELDMSMFETESMDGWYFTSLQDTAYVIQGLVPDSLGIIVIRSSDLQSEFNPNLTADVLSIWDENFGVAEVFRYGDGEDARISAPLPGQSMSLMRSWRFFWCLDSSPTLGDLNDEEGISGGVEGHVYSTTSAVIEGSWIIYEYLPFSPDTLFAVTDDNGYYSFDKSTELRFVRVFAEGYVPLLDWVQVWPDSTVTRDFYLSPTVSLDDGEVEIPKHVELAQNYPNPFNASTVIKFSIPEASQVEIDVFKLDGSPVAHLLSKKMTAGNHEISWNAASIPSGIYVYTLQANNIKLSRKMILLK